MKRRNFKLLISALVISLCVPYACSNKFLEKPPLGAFSQAVLTNQAGVEGLLIGAYHMVGGEGGAAGNSFASGPSNWAIWQRCSR